MGKQIEMYPNRPDKSYQKRFSKYVCLVRCRRQHFRTIKYKRNSRFIFPKTTIARVQVLRSERLLCIISLSTLVRFKNTFSMIISFFERFIILVQRMCMSYVSTKIAGNKAMIEVWPKPKQMLGSSDKNTVK